MTQDAAAWGSPDPAPGPAGWAPQPLWPTPGPPGGQALPLPAARPPPFTACPHAAEQPYHHLLRTPRWRWWRPLAGLPLLAVLWLLANLLLLGIAALGTWVTGTELQLFLGADTGDVGDIGPLVLLTDNLSLAALIPAAALAVLVVHRERPGWLSSVTGRLRWSLLWRFTLLALLTTLVGDAGSLLVP